MTKTYRNGVLLCALLAAILLALPSVLSAQEEAKGVEAAPAPVGPETCMACHEDLSKSFAKQVHRRVGCESCHGPAAKHAETAEPGEIRQPAKLPTAEAERICLSCHRSLVAKGSRARGGHSTEKVGCTTCHSVHPAPDAPPLRQARSVNQKCGSCHSEQLLEFRRPFTHRLTQGAMSCTDCHNPHGSATARFAAAAATKEAGCVSCHGDKRGPFAFEHAPVKLEGCATCHEPHGSVNPKMLTRNKIGMQCLECHSNIGAGPAAGGVATAFHDLRTARFQNCTTCHVKIHGSHVSRSLLR